MSKQYHTQFGVVNSVQVVRFVLGNVKINIAIQRILYTVYNSETNVLEIIIECSDEPIVLEINEEEYNNFEYVFLVINEINENDEFIN